MAKRKTVASDPLRPRPHRMTIDWEDFDWEPMLAWVAAENEGTPKDQRVNPTILVRRAVRAFLPGHFINRRAAERAEREGFNEAVETFNEMSVPDANRKIREQ